MSDILCTRDSALAMFYMQRCTRDYNYYLLEILVTSTHIKGHGISRFNGEDQGKIVCQRITSKIFGIFRFLWQAVPSNLNVASQVVRGQITSKALATCDGPQILN